MPGASIQALPGADTRPAHPLQRDGRASDPSAIGEALGHRQELVDGLYGRPALTEFWEKSGSLRLCRPAVAEKLRSIFVVDFPVERIGKDVVVDVLMITVVADNVIVVIPLPGHRRATEPPYDLPSNRHLVCAYDCAN